MALLLAAAVAVLVLFMTCLRSHVFNLFAPICLFLQCPMARNGGESRAKMYGWMETEKEGESSWANKINY